MAIATPRVPIQTPLFDADGNLTRTWILFLESLGQTGGAVAAGVATVQIDGTLGIGADLAPPLWLNVARAPIGVRAALKQAPTGANLGIEVHVGATLWLSLTIAAGTTTVVATQAALAAAGPIAAATNVRLDVTGVGTTFPGADLSVFIYFD